MNLPSLTIYFYSRPEYLINQYLADFNLLQSKTVRLPHSLEVRGIQILVNETSITMLQHAGNGQYGPFNADQAQDLVRTIKRNITHNTRAVILLGCEVDKTFALNVQANLQSSGFYNAQVKVLKDGILATCTGGQWLFSINLDKGTFSIAHENPVVHFGNGDFFVKDCPLEELPNHLTSPENLLRE